MPLSAKPAKPVIILKIPLFSLLFAFRDKEEYVPINYGIIILAFGVNGLCIVLLYAFCLLLKCCS